MNGIFNFQPRGTGALQGTKINRKGGKGVEAWRILIFLVTYHRNWYPRLVLSRRASNFQNCSRPSLQTTGVPSYVVQSYNTKPSLAETHREAKLVPSFVRIRSSTLLTSLVTRHIVFETAFARRVVRLAWSKRLLKARAPGRKAWNPLGLPGNSSRSG